MTISNLTPAQRFIYNELPPKAKAAPDSLILEYINWKLISDNARDKLAQEGLTVTGYRKQPKKNPAYTIYNNATAHWSSLYNLMLRTDCDAVETR